MEIDNIKILKVRDSSYWDKLQGIDKNAIYCEIKYKRDKSSFAGMGFILTERKNTFWVQRREERLIQIIDKYEKLYVGCDLDYINSVKNFFKMKERNYGIDVLFLVYSDVKSSQIVFESLMKKIDENIDVIKELL